MKGYGIPDTGYGSKQTRQEFLFLGCSSNTCRHRKASSQEKSLTCSLQPAACSRISGFTLLEVLVALAVVGLAVTAILELLSFNLNAIGTSEDQVRASLAAEARMREVLDDGDLAEKSWSEITRAGYRVDVTINKVQKERADLVGVDLYQIDLSLTWSRGPRKRTVTLKTLKAVQKQNMEAAAG